MSDAMRETFEQSWYGYWASIGVEIGTAFERDDDGDYVISAVEDAWQGWQLALEHEGRGVEPFAYCFTDVNGEAKELCSAPTKDDDPRDMRTVTALYKHPPAPVVPNAVLAVHQAMRVEENTVYIAGPMSGIEDYNFPAFNQAAKSLEGHGFSVFNPADHGIIQGAEWQHYLRSDIMRLVLCRAIYLLPGWSKSNGALLEHHIASQLGMKILFDDQSERQPPEPVVESANASSSQVCVPEGQHMMPTEFLREYLELLNESDFRAVHKMIRQNMIEAMLNTATGTPNDQ